MSEVELQRVARAAVPDYFALFDLPRRYDLDLAELEARYLARSREVHPDRFASRPAAERVVALGQAMELNQAYRTLKRALPRAEHLLAGHGVDIGANEAVAPALLMEVLELREELAEARAAGDQGAIARLGAAMRGRERGELAILAERFAAVEQGGDPAVRQAALAATKAQIILLRYLARYLAEVDQVQEDAA